MLPFALKNLVGNNVGEITEIGWGVMQLTIQTAALPHIAQMLATLDKYKISEKESMKEGQGLQSFDIETQHNFNCALMDLPKTIQGWINDYLEDQAYGFEWCDKHGQYWWEDGCPGCAAEADQAARQQELDPFEPAYEDQFSPCPSCDKPIFWEDWPYCQHCDSSM